MKILSLKKKKEARVTLTISRVEQLPNTVRSNNNGYIRVGLNGNMTRIVSPVDSLRDIAILMNCYLDTYIKYKKGRKVWIRIGVYMNGKCFDEGRIEISKYMNIKEKQSIRIQLPGGSIVVGLINVCDSDTKHDQVREAEEINNDISFISCSFSSCLPSSIPSSATERKMIIGKENEQLKEEIMIKEKEESRKDKVLQRENQWLIQEADRLRLRVEREPTLSAVMSEISHCRHMIINIHNDTR